MFLNELIHQLLALCIVQHNNFDTAGFEILLTTEEGSVFSDDDTWNVVQQNSTSAHVARASDIVGQALIKLAR